MSLTSTHVDSIMSTTLLPNTASIHHASPSEPHLTTLHQWLSTTLHSIDYSLSPIQNDASMRRYYRLSYHNQTRMVSHTPPEQPLFPSLYTANLLANLQVRVPKIHHFDLIRGFLIQEDFGEQMLASVDDPGAFSWYKQAIDQLIHLQKQYKQRPCTIPIPHFDQHALLQEFDIFLKWYVQQHCGHTPSPASLTQLNHTYQKLIQCAHEQPQTLVHRDYHSRNLLMLPDQQLGIIDYQDLVIGPIAYDLVSLLKDCYISRTHAFIDAGLDHYLTQATSHQLTNIDHDTLQRWIDWLGLQRHLKCLGIFARLHYRDGKSQYLPHLPRLHDYIADVCQRYEDLRPIYTFIEDITPCKHS